MIVDKSLILKELKSYKGFKTDVSFAKFLGIAPNVLANWYKRNTFDEHVIVNLFPELSKSWLLAGEGNMLKGTSEATPALNDGCACPFTESMAGILENMKSICDVNKKLVDQQSDLIAAIKALSERK